jgi:hypothetical protein
MRFLIRLYRNYISPLFKPSCRFQPTCSEYALQSIERFGSIKGSYLMILRITRCNPLFKSGYDPVPEEFNLFHKPKGL